MKCIEVEKHLDAFFDGEIVSSKEIEAHLENCGSCRKSFENLGAIRRTLKQNFAVSAPSLLGEKVSSAFQNHHEAKRGEKERQTEKIGWFGIPRFAFASALILFALATISAFQIGRMSVGERTVVMPQIRGNKDSKDIDSTKNNPTDEEKSVQIRYVEVPVIREKILKIPVIREKTVTKTVYVNKTEKPSKVLPAKEDFALTNKIEDNKYLTRSNLEGFQVVSEMNLRVSKEENQK